MASLYNTMLRTGAVALSAVHSLPKCLTGNGKTRMFVDGQASALAVLSAQFVPAERNFWFHCSSYGEYAIARPIIAEIKRREPTAKVVLTFFSPTGVNALRPRPNRHQADYVGFLPIDTPDNATRLVELIRPTAAAFMVSEYWPNILGALHSAGVPTYLVSAIFSRNTPHFHPILGETFRRSLEAYTHAYVLDEASCCNLRELGFTRVSLSGDPLMDNALAVSQTPWTHPALEAFCRGRRVMIAGSISDKRDLQLCAHVANQHPAERFVFVPHEVDEAHLKEVEAALLGKSCRLSQFDAEKELPQVLIVDTIGQLSRLYRYGTMAYVGGGFTPQLHSIIEASVYGLPVAFGPRTERKVTPKQLCQLQVGRIVTTPQELNLWYESVLHASDEQLAEWKRVATAYCQRLSGATDAIASAIMNN
jgi:3-deoxy-D-manno-octulosonic-acid transferase